MANSVLPVSRSASAVLAIVMAILPYASDYLIAVVADLILETGMLGWFALHATRPCGSTALDAIIGDALNVLARIGIEDLLAHLDCDDWFTLLVSDCYQSTMANE